tara:strand:+ start:76 stop:825 length:750 start_codon:yes stop_codon:yes gene_type:complete
MERLKTYTDTALDGKYYVDYAYIKEPLDRAIMLFATKGLEVPSPAMVAAMRVGKPVMHPFWQRTVTNMDIVARPERGDYILFNNKVLNNLYTKDLVKLLSHSKFGKNKFRIPKKDKKFINEIIEEAITNGKASICKETSAVTIVNEINKKDYLKFMFDNVKLGISTQEFGNYLSEKEFGGLDRSFGTGKYLTYSLCTDPDALDNSYLYLSKIIMHNFDHNHMFDILYDWSHPTYTNSVFGVRFRLVEDH